MALEEEVVEKEPSLDQSMEETIRSTLKDITSREPEAVETAPTEPVEPKADRPRDTEGKFTKPEKSKDIKEPAAATEKADKTPPAGPTETTAAAPQEQPLVTTTGQPIDLNRPPSSWKPGAKAVWNTLPEPVRAEVYRREAEYHVGLKDIKTNADFGQTIQKTIEPYRMLIEAEGGTPERAIADTMRTAALFRVGTPQQKLQAIFDLDKRFNIGLGGVIKSEVDKAVAQQNGQPAPIQQQPQVFQDPRVDQLLAAQQKADKERVERETAVVNQATERFLTAKDDKGQPLYPFVDNVLQDMTERVTAIRRQNPALSADDVFKQAYDAAVWANPETRAVLVSQQQATANQSTETQRKLEAAKRASSVNVPKRGAMPASTPSAPFGSPEADEQMKETLRALMAS